MKVWITKYALTQGIMECEAEICENISAEMISVKNKGFCNSLYHGKGKEWHESKESAIKKAEEMRKKKIESLKKQIEKLEKIKFEDSIY